MKKILFLLFIGLMFIGISSAGTYCYQEYANVSTTCGGLATGSYSVGGAAWTNQNSLYDGNWGNYGVTSNPGVGSQIYINYTKPSSATSAILKFNNNVDKNYSVAIPTSCFNSTISIKFTSGSEGLLQCFNSSNSYENLITQISGGNQLFEEGIYWKVTGITTENATIGNCDDFYNSPLINFTFKDELTQTNINGSISNALIEYYLGDSSITNTYSRINNTEYPSISICTALNNVTTYADIYAPYSYSTYPQRIYQDDLQLTKTVTNKVLYLLSSTDGQYVTYQLINAADQPLENVMIVLNKSISGSQTVIGTVLTGADGGATFWLNPDDQYTVCAYLSPYPSYCTTQSFTQDSYTITLGSSSSINVSDYNKGISYSFTPTDEWLNNDTDYTFNFSLTSSYWVLQEFGFNITNGTYSFLNRTNSTSSTGGSTSFLMNTGQNKTLIVTYYWIVNNITTQFVRTYRILDFSQNQYSMTRLLSDFSSYTSSGLFGLTELGKGLIIFFIIVGIVGAAKVKFGISDESTLAGLFFATVVFFDVGLGLIPNPVGAVSHFPSIVIGIIFLGFAVKEMRT